MQIFFSTLFDSPTYPLNIFFENGVAIGKVHLGPIGLLNVLELHSGVPGDSSSTIERTFKYRDILQKNRTGTFYERSLQSNDLDVATTLLRWRDELKLAGWDFKTDHATPPRLKALAKAEDGSLSPGISDRYRAIIDVLKQKPILPVEKIILHEPLELLPPFYQELLTTLKEAGVIIEERTPAPVKKSDSDLSKLQQLVLHQQQPEKKHTAKKDGSLQIIRFGNMLSVANGIAALLANDTSFKPVIINESNDPSLALAMRSKGLPYTGQALHAISHPDLQLLAILPVWLWKPYNPQQVLDFLLCPFNILPERLCVQWSELFSGSPGICMDKWMEILNTYVSKIEDEKQKTKLADRLKYLLDVGTDRNHKLPAETIREFYNYFYTIFNRRLNVIKDEPTKLRLERLCNAFATFISILDTLSGQQLDALELQRLITLVLQPVSIVPYARQVGSLQEIEHPGLLVNDCKDLLWFGFTAVKSSHAVWDHWSEEEMKWLQTKSVHLDTAAAMAKRQFWWVTSWLRFVKGRLILIIPTVVDGEPAQPHSFQSFIDACFSNLHDITIHVEQPDQMRLLDQEIVKTIKTTLSLIPTYPVYWNISNGKLLDRRKTSESFNSIEKLMFFPYQWVLNYKAQWRRGNTFCLPGLHLFYGNLSHAIFQELLLMADIAHLGDQELKKRYAAVAQKNIHERGLLLHMSGQEGPLKIFEEFLWEKFRVLQKYITDNQWKVEACEITKEAAFGSEVINGRCDVLLKRIKNKSTEHAIIDLKYSGVKKYRELMNRGEDLQLAIYSRIFHPSAKQCPTAYFIISEGLLFTPCPDSFKGARILDKGGPYADTYSQLINKMQETIVFRRKELKQGIIEVGEEVETTKLDIFSKVNAETHLMPPSKNGLKECSRYNDYSTFIDTE